MNLDKDEQRGESARRILGESLYKEAFAVIEERLLGQLAVIEITRDRAEYLRTLLVANRKIRAYLEQVMVTGQMASEQKSFMERLREKTRF